MSNRAEVPYLQGEFPEGGQAKINFSTFTESVPARLGEQKVSRWETYPGYLVHPLDEGDPLTYERLKDYSVTSLAQDLFKSAINAVQANHAGDLESQNYYESEAANNLLYYRDYPDVTTEALELAQQANDEGWPFVAATNGSFPIAIKYRDLPANFDPALPIEVDRKSVV